MEIGITNIVTYILLAASWLVFFILMIKIDDKLNLPEPSSDKSRFVNPGANAAGTYMYDQTRSACNVPEQPVQFVNEPEEDRPE